MGCVSETRSGYRQSVSGLVGAVAACLGLILVIWLLSRLQGGDDVEAAPTVNYSAQLETARAEASFDVLTPATVPEDWRATSVDWDVAGPVETWQLGFLTDDDEFVGLEQGNAQASDVVEGATPADRPGSPVTIEGDSWQTLSSGEGETALVLVDGDITVVVTGTAPEADLTAFAASLSAD